jgi:hypothetical protein
MTDYMKTYYDWLLTQTPLSYLSNEVSDFLLATEPVFTNLSEQRGLLISLLVLHWFLG